MKHETLAQAMDEIQDVYIAEAVKPKRKTRLPWLGAAAALLAVCIAAGLIWNGRQTPTGSDIEAAVPSTAPTEDTGTRYIPSRGQQFLLAAPSYPDMIKYADRNWSQWREGQNAQYDQPRSYAAGTELFFRSSIQTILTEENRNQTYSPLNVYMALAMLTETADGNSRQQLLELLGADSAEALQVQANHMWNAHYSDDGLTTLLLASSLWLEETFTYDEDTVNTLAGNYYASVYRGDLGSDPVNQALQGWLNDHTGNLLQEQAQNIELSDTATMALATTIYYNVEWADAFFQEKNTEASFYAPTGDRTVTYMNRALFDSRYYQGPDFSAVALDLKDSGRMWLVLPQEGDTPAELLQSGHVLDLVLGDHLEYPDQTCTLVNLSVPKFDVVSDMDLIPALKALGITDIFDPGTADFSDLITDTEDFPYIGQVQHAARVAIDEEGVLAAAFTVIERDAAATEISDKIDFILDRPFLFCIESRDGIPLFAGIVNEP